jgi:polyisoprenyl-phosphate glycosyltransferase
MEDKNKMISIVTPCFNEEDNILDCYKAIKNLFETGLTGYDYEHIFCDNASTDHTVPILKGLALQDKHVKIIINSRNFGPFRSTFNGLLNTRGDAVVVLLAADLQDPPGLILDFVKKWEEGYHIVYGIREKREEHFLMVFIRRRYYRLIHRFAEVEIPPDVGEFQLIDRVVVEALKGFDDYYPFIRGMIASCGFRTTGLPYVWRRRERGFSKNRLYHLIDQGLNGLISFTNIPLRLCMFFGFILALLSITYAVIQLVVNLLFFRSLAPPGIATLIVGLFFFSGVQLFFLGFLGEYIGAIHSQVRKRPLVIEKERINF